MAEWSNAHPWKGCIRAIVSGVRIPLSPPRQNSVYNAYFVGGERVKRGALYVGIRSCCQLDYERSEII